MELLGESDEKPFQLKAELAEKINRFSEIIDDDPYVIRLSAMRRRYKMSPRCNNGDALQRAAYSALCVFL